jgi:hypothetical protein
MRGSPFDGRNIQRDKTFTKWGRTLSYILNISFIGKIVKTPKVGFYKYFDRQHHNGRVSSRKKGSPSL